ncbi:PKD domain-containing protein [Blastococcus capsensis]|uniref:PKD domain-containing protein n=1 Tax=Blastococcus capsensis TaxID=1564163 RepID=UPI00253FC634|nr:hypothetical protein [Blastococcus capsensis]MDK3257089.1 hypothetical protein [Blastococcus capsensis]
MNSTGATRMLLVAALVGGGVAVLPPAVAQAGTVDATLVKTTWTGGSNSDWAHPSPDPSGITYNSVTGKLIISDGEVEETNLSYHVYEGTNLFVASLDGKLLETGANTLAYSNEPVGVGFRPALSADFPERLFVSDDDKDRVFEVNRGSDGRYGTSDDTQTSFSTKFMGTKDDAEDVAVDLELSRNGQLLIIDGYHKEVYVYGPGPNKKFDGLPSVGGDDTVSSFDVYAHGARDPEGIAYNPYRNTMFVLDDPSNQILEFGLDGKLQNIVKLPFTMKSGAGIALAPPSNGSGAPNAYIVDRGVDNDTNGDTFNDGRLYEVAIPGLTGDSSGTNTAPTVDAGPSLSVVQPNAASLDGTVSDSTPSGTLTQTWTKDSGPGTVTFTDASAVDTTATFSATGDYVLRLTASDGSLSASDTTAVTVTDGNGGGGALDIAVATGSDDAEERPAGKVLLGSGDLNLGQEDSALQTVGMRFTNVTIPAGATITKAYVQFQADEVKTAASSLTITAEVGDAPPTFTTASKSVSARLGRDTVASVPWSPVGWPTVGERKAAQQTADLSPVLQELVNNSTTWDSGDPVVLLVTGTGERAAESYNGGAAKAPVLHIEYTQ